MTEEDDYRRVEKRGAALYERWKNEHPEAAHEIAQAQTNSSVETLDAWRAKYPEAVAGYARIGFYSRDCVRKMRMTVPGWEPPSEWDLPEQD